MITEQNLNKEDIDYMMDFCRGITDKIHHLVVASADGFRKEKENLLPLVPSSLSYALLSYAISSCMSASIGEQQVHTLVNDFYSDIKKKYQ
jgi:hypothetical protein